VSKTYEALLDGNVKDDEGIIKLRMRPDPDDPPRQIADPDHGKQAVSHWRVKERNGGQTLVELYPDTGRTHQLRVHCAHPQGLNAPIHGDRLYGKGITNGSKLCLRAKSIVITLHGERRTFSCP
jgi:tRNA pseudouridine32 synthase/23S rRNA pseudouridine746 synthase